jgi:hypothetical protein
MAVQIDTPDAARELLIEEEAGSALGGGAGAGRGGEIRQDNARLKMVSRSVYLFAFFVILRLRHPRSQRRVQMQLSSSADDYNSRLSRIRDKCHESVPHRSVTGAL